MKYAQGKCVILHQSMGDEIVHHFVRKFITRSSFAETVMIFLELEDICGVTPNFISTLRNLKNDIFTTPRDILKKFSKYTKKSNNLSLDNG